MHPSAAKLLALGLFMIALAWPAPRGMAPEASRLVAVTVLMAVLWLTQAIPLAATSLIPLVAFPLLGIQTAKQVSGSYMSESIFLLLGGFIIARGVEKWGLHRRTALHLVHVVGTSPRRTVLGFMLATAFLSMWISNTASTLLMLPIAVAFLDSLRAASSGGPEGADDADESAKDFASFSVVMLLSIAYSASIGGFTTQVGTPANIQFRNIWVDQFPAGPEIGAGQWMIGVIPIGAVMLLLAWVVLTWRVPMASGFQRIDRDHFRRQIAALGRPQRPEILMFVILLLAAVLWVSRKPVVVGEVTLLPGWGPWMEAYLIWLGGDPAGAVGAVGDSTVAILLALVMFFVPARRGGGETLMDWNGARELPWAVLLLVGGGFALAGAFSETGLSRYLGDVFARHGGGLPAWLLVPSVCLLLTFLTEFTSNVATVSALLPILAATAVRIEIDPRLIMIPATLSTTCAFMLPIGTPPNAVIFSSGRVGVAQMAYHGIRLNLISVIIITLATFIYLVPSFGISLDAPPEWATPR